MIYIFIFISIGGKKKEEREKEGFCYISEILFCNLLIINKLSM